MWWSSTHSVTKHTILGLGLELDNILIPVSADHYGDPYVKRKELVEGALLLGMGMIKVKCSLLIIN